MRKRFFCGLAVGLTALVVPIAAAQAADQGNAGATLSFFSGGDGANAHWQHDLMDSPTDTDFQDIEINTTNGANGYAGILVHHVYGWPTADYPDSSFNVKSNQDGASAGSPRLVIRFSDGGDGELRPLMNTSAWQPVTDPNWDSNGGSCGYQYEVTWQKVQQCHAGTYVTNVYLTTDPLGVTYWIDNLSTAGKTWNRAADNGNGGS